VQQVDKPLTIVNVQSEVSLTSTTQVQQTATTTSTVNVITGNKITTTNDQTVISTDVTIQQLTHKVIAQLPQLIGYTVSEVIKTEYNQIS
jgi:hypothetical protein